MLVPNFILQLWTCMHMIPHYGFHFLYYKKQYFKRLSLRQQNTSPLNPSQLLNNCLHNPNPYIFFNLHQLIIPVSFLQFLSLFPTALLEVSISTIEAKRIMESVPIVPRRGAIKAKILKEIVKKVKKGALSICTCRFARNKINHFSSSSSFYS